MGAFLAGLKGWEHSGYTLGLAWIESHGGELVATRRGVDGANLDTYRIRFPEGDVLATWGHPGVLMGRGRRLPQEWAIVRDMAKR